MRTPASMCASQEPLAQRGLALGQLDQRVDALGRLDAGSSTATAGAPSAASSPTTSVR